MSLNLKAVASQWQDVSARVWEAAAADCADNFIERWNYIGSEEMDEDDNVPHIPPLAPPGNPHDHRWGLSRVFRSPQRESCGQEPSPTLSQVGLTPWQPKPGRPPIRSRRALGA